ncbi:MAG TPA: DUF3152 domain-containing protein, partial [Solirubrobacteraceae bacterium]
AARVDLGGPPLGPSAPAQVDLGVLTSVPGRRDLALVPGTSAVAGTGPLRRFAVEVQRGIRIDRAAFGAAVERILLNPRGWTGAGGLALQRVDSGVVDLRVTLARPAMVDRLCFPLLTRGVADCFNRVRAVINLDRWTHGSRPWGRDLAHYRDYLINHEVGHGLGHGHRSCPGLGRRSFVMMQQTGTAFGCRTQPWPRRSEQRVPLVPPRVLAFDPAAADALRTLAGRDRRLTVVRRGPLSRVAAVVATTPASAAVRRWVRAGGGLVALGAATGTAGAPAPVPATVTVPDHRDPPTLLAPPAFATTASFVPAGIVHGHVLAFSGGLPVAWCRRQGHGRVLYDALGIDQWPNAGQQALVAGGLAWVTGLAGGPGCR